MSWQYHEDNNTVTVVGTDELIADCKDSANGYLIAAAPYMLYLLKECLQDDIDEDLAGDIMWLILSLIHI